MTRNGQLLVTYFDGMPDRWATKPPLVIWLVAAGLRVGLSPLLALRLPSGLAATTIVLLVFFFCRNLLQDRVAGLIAGLTLLTGPLFVGWHAGRTGDYDIFVTLFTLIYTLSFWRYLETEGRTRTQWIFVAGLSVFLAVLTKGVGGVLALPGLVLYVVARRASSRTFLDPRLWLSLAGVVLLCGTYYGLREHLDPGYVHAVWVNDFTSRYLVVNEGHKGGPLYYVQVLFERFEPGFILLLVALIPLWFGERRRRSAALICLFAAGFLFAVLTQSKTKNFWYAIPATPLIAVATGIGLSAGLAWLQSRRQTLPRILHPRVAYAALGIIFAIAAVTTVYYYQVGVERKLSVTNMEGRYGPFLEEIRGRALTHRVVILDYGIGEVGPDAGTPPYYSPEADFYAKLENGRGMQVEVAVPGKTLEGATWIATCDPRSQAWVVARYEVAVAMQPDAWCRLEQIGNPKQL
jgi:4-amino-4-deoxy-L-arabinose transferase-like glycosyltransferase